MRPSELMDREITRAGHGPASFSPVRGAALRLFADAQEDAAREHPGDGTYGYRFAWRRPCLGLAR
jgi:hypothetical protein